MTVYFTADTHFGHENIIRFCNRPFASASEMNRALITNWNTRVTEDDDVYVLGDFAFRCGDSVREIAHSLKGHKHLVIGNHDFKWMQADPDAVAEFVEVAPMLEIEEGGRQLTLCHYPMMAWRNSSRDFSWLIYGHIHNNTDDCFWPLLRGMECALNAGTDVNWFFPVTFDEMVENNRKWKEQNASCSNS